MILEKKKIRTDDSGSHIQLEIILPPISSGSNI